MLGHLLEVVRGAVRHPAEDELLGRAAGEHDLHHVDQLLLRVEVALLHGQVVRVPERVAAGDDRHLLDRQHVAHQVGHQRVTGLVVGEDPLLLLGDDPPLLEAGDHPLHRGLEVGLADVLQLVAAGEDRRLVADVREVGARQPGRLARDAGCRSTSDASGLPRVCTPRIASRPVRSGGGDEHLPIEAAGPQQRGSRSWSRFDAPMTTTLSRSPKPSSSTSSWFSVWSCSRLKPPPVRACRPRRARR